MPCTKNRAVAAETFNCRTAFSSTGHTLPLQRSSLRACRGTEDPAAAGSPPEGDHEMAAAAAEEGTGLAHTQLLQSIQQKREEHTAERAGRHSAALEREAAAVAGLDAGFGGLAGLAGLAGAANAGSAGQRRLPKLTRKGPIAGKRAGK
jgi:hypothetical protein